MYIKPKNFWDAIGQLKEVYGEDLGTISSGDSVELSETFLVQDTFELRIDGSAVSEDDYTLDLRKGEVNYAGTSGDAVADYKHANKSNEEVVSAINAAVDYIEENTNTTFNGTETRNVYVEGQGSDKDYILIKQPVKDIASIEYLEDDGTTTSLNEGIDKDYVQNNTGYKIVSDDLTDSEMEDEYTFKVNYSYGYESIPSWIERAVVWMVANDFLKLNVADKNILGRDDFNPDTANIMESLVSRTIEKYRISHFGLVANETKV